MPKLLHNDTQEIQELLGKYCRTGVLEAPIKGAVEERLPHYRRLVFNVIKDTLRSAYPLAFELIKKEKFDALCFDFFATYACQEAQVYRIAGEFYTYFSELETPLKNQFPFLEELLSFEWTEMEMYMMEDVATPATKSSGNWETDVLVLNPESHLLQFSYPVFKKKTIELSAEDKALYYCFAFRQQESGRIIFIDVSPVVAMIISEIAEENTLETALKTLAQSGIVLSEQQKNTVIQFLQNEAKNDMILGFKK